MQVASMMIASERDKSFFIIYLQSINNMVRLLYRINM
jgi:hypothetical protein